MSRKRLLKLTWADADGTPYHTAEMSPRTARDVIAGDHGSQLYLDHVPFPLHHLTYAEVCRLRRCAIVKLSGDKTGHTILIDIVE